MILVAAVSAALHPTVTQASIVNPSAFVGFNAASKGTLTYPPLTSMQVVRALEASCGGTVSVVPGAGRLDVDRGGFSCGFAQRPVSDKRWLSKNHLGVPSESRPNVVEVKNDMASDKAKQQYDCK
jgi:hypothetical protein